MGRLREALLPLLEERGITEEDFIQRVAELGHDNAPAVLGSSPDFYHVRYAQKILGLSMAEVYPLVDAAYFDATKSLGVTVGAIGSALSFTLLLLL